MFQLPESSENPNGLLVVLRVWLYGSAIILVLRERVVRGLVPGRVAWRHACSTRNKKEVVFETSGGLGVKECERERELVVEGSSVLG